MSEYLFDHSNKVFEIIKKSDKILLFLDYDGTLVSFKDKPNEVSTSNKMRIILKKLIQDPKFIVFIVSGRTLRDIKSLLNIEGLSFAALHGLQIEFSDGKNFSWKPAENAQPFLDKIKEEVLYDFKDEEGVYIEDKELTLAFHYRLLPENKIKDATRRFIEIVKKIDKNSSLEIINGAKVVEIRPKGWNKGKATENILKKVGEGKNPLPIYIGDDATDEDAFNHLENHGITIFVSNNSKKSTAAHYWLKNPDDVFTFLKSLLEVKKKA